MCVSMLANIQNLFKVLIFPNGIFDVKCELIKNQILGWIKSIIISQLLINNNQKQITVQLC